MRLESTDRSRKRRQSPLPTDSALKTNGVSGRPSGDSEFAMERASLPSGDARDKRRRIWLGCAACAGLISFFLSLTAFNLVDVDIWHQMALIRESLRVGHLLTRDVFAYTPSVYPSIHHEWGAGLLAYALTRWFGGDAVLLLKFSVVIVIGLVSLRSAKSMGADTLTWVALCPIAIFLSQFGFLAVIRAQAYSFLFAACCFWAFEQDRRGKRGWMMAWLCVFPVWVNVHGGFVVGIGLLALYVIECALAGRPFRMLSWLLAATILEVFINPFGPQLFGYIAHAVTMSRPHIQEWRPVWVSGFWGTAVFFIAMAIAAYGVARIGIRRSPGLLMLIAAAVEAILHFKLVPLFAIAWISHVPAYLEQSATGTWISSFTRRRFALVLGFWLLVTTLSLTNAVHWQFWRLRVPQINAPYAYPVGAVDYLRGQRFTGNLMVPFLQGAYVSWKLFPAVKVSVDSRYEVAYPEALVDSIFRFYAAEPGWRQILDAYRTDLVLVPRMTPLEHVIAETGWHKVYVDREFEIYARPDLALPFCDHASESFSGVFP